MTLEEIEKQWSVDCNIDIFKLADEAIKIPKLHAKYYQMYVREKLSVEKMKSTRDSLEEILYGFFSKTLSNEELDEYNLSYSDRKYLKTDIPRAVAAHSDMVELNLKIALGQEKVEFLKSVLNMINTRSFQIKNAIDFKKFEAGG